MRRLVVTLVVGVLSLAAGGCDSQRSDASCHAGPSTLTSLSTATGDVGWTTRVGQAPYADTDEEGLVLGGGNVLVRGACGAAVVDGTTGQVRYDAPAPGQLLGTTHDRLLVRDEADTGGSVRLVGIDLATGRSTSSYSTGLPYRDATMVGSHLVSLFGDQLTGDDPATSARSWELQVSLGGRQQLVAGGRLVLAVGGDGSTYAVRVADGRLLWRTVPPVAAPTYALRPTTVPGTVLTAATTFDDSAASRSFVYATDARSGRLRWSRPAVAVLAADPDLTVLRTPRAVIAVGTSTGEMRWRRASSDPVETHGRSTAALTGGVVAVLRSGRVVGLDRRSGRVRWQGPDASSVLAAGRTVVATTEGGVMGLDARTGATRWVRPPSRERQEVVVAGRRTLVLDTDLVGHVIEG